MGRILTTIKYPGLSRAIILKVFHAWKKHHDIARRQLYLLRYSHCVVNNIGIDFDLHTSTSEKVRGCRQAEEARETKAAPKTDRPLKLAVLALVLIVW